MQMQVINYLLNKFCPVLIISFLVIYKFGLQAFEPYVIIGLLGYMNYFNYKVGYAMGVCESKNLL